MIALIIMAIAFFGFLFWIGGEAFQLSPELSPYGKGSGSVGFSKSDSCDQKSLLRYLKQDNMKAIANCADSGETGVGGYTCVDVDLDSNDEVGPSDLALLLGVWGDLGCQGDLPCEADVNEDGTVGPFDLAILLGNWGPCEESLKNV